MKVSEVMTPQARIASPDDSLSHIAKVMADEHIGFLPVGENDRLVGMITDRDMVVRALAKGRDGNSHVRDCMTKDVKYCFEDDELDKVVRSMGEQKVRRMPVINRDKRLVGVVSLGDEARNGGQGMVGDALSHIAEPGGPHAT